MAWTEAVLQLWFDDAALNTPRAAWFQHDPAFDAAIAAAFLPLQQQLAAGALPCDSADARATLAWLIVADQFSRNLFRGDAAAFACDAQALAVTQAALAAGLDQQLPPVARWFFYLPLEHSEQLAMQQRSLVCFNSLPPDSPGWAQVIDYAERHHAIIARFGRFPHRNAALGRTSTPDELLFLQQPGSAF